MALVSKQFKKFLSVSRQQKVNLVIQGLIVNVVFLFFRSGLRTLCIAMAELEPEEFQRWSDIYYKASTSLENREQNVDEAAELIEKVRWLFRAVVQLSIAFRMHQIILASQRWLRSFHGALIYEGCSDENAILDNIVNSKTAYTVTHPFSKFRCILLKKATFISGECLLILFFFFFGAEVICS